MIYYLTSQKIFKSRQNGLFTSPDETCVEISLANNPVRSRIIDYNSLLKLVDDGILSAGDKNDIVFIRAYSADILKCLRILKNREFKLINALDTAILVRDVKLWVEKLKNNNIPVSEPFNYQSFSKINLDRTRGFGQPLEDFIIEYSKEYNLKEFILRPRYGSARWSTNNTKVFGGYSISDVKSFNWSEVDTDTHSYYLINGLPTKTIRIPVVAKKIIAGACLSTSEVFIENLKIDQNSKVIEEYPIIETYANNVINTLNLEVGYIDFHIINDEIKVFDVSNYDQDHPNPFNLTSLIVDYLLSVHEN